MQKSKIKMQNDNAKSKMRNPKHEIRNPKQIHTSSRKIGMFVLCLMFLTLHKKYERC